MERLYRYGDVQVSRLNRASQLCYGVMDELSMAAVLCAIEDWGAALKHTEIALELRTTASQLLDSGGLEHLCARLPQIEENLAGPLSNIDHEKRTGITFDRMDVRHLDGDPEMWDNVLRAASREFHALGDNLGEEANADD